MCGYEKFFANARGKEIEEAVLEFYRKLRPGEPVVLENAQKFFNERLKGRYYSPFLPREDNGISADLPYDNNTNSSFYFSERLISSEYLWRYLEDIKENTFLQFYRDIGILDVLRKDHA